MLCDGNTYNYGYIGTAPPEASRAITWLSGQTGRGDAPRDQEGLPVEHPVIDRHLSYPAFQSRRYRQRQEGAGWLQGAATVRLPKAAATAARPSHQLPEKIDTELAKTNFFDYLDFALQSAGWPSCLMLTTPSRCWRMGVRGRGS